jgi:hypothetical protein
MAMTYPDDFYDIIEAYRAQSAFWRERHAATDAITAKLHSKTDEAVARSRELLRKTRPLVDDCPVLRGRLSSSDLIRGSTGPSLPPAADIRRSLSVDHLTEPTTSGVVLSSVLTPSPSPSSRARRKVCFLPWDVSLGASW